MYSKEAGSYDVIPEGLKRYINNYGCHFNKKLATEAASRMYKYDGNDKVYIKPYTKETVDKMLDMYGVHISRNKLYDAVYVANMCKADFLGSSVVDEAHLCLYVKDVIDDIDGYDGIVFNRWYADMCRNGIVINWYDVL